VKCALRPDFQSGFHRVNKYTLWLGVFQVIGRIV